MLNTRTATLPPIKIREWLDLEDEAQRPFLSLDQVYEYRRRHLTDLALEELLNETRSENRRRSRRD